MKLRKYLTSAAFLAVLLLFAIGHILLPDNAVSTTERRPLKQFPTISVSSIIDGSFGTNLEAYLLDQFPLRDSLRSLKAFWQFDIYRQADNNGIYLVGDHVCKLDSTLKQDEVDAFLKNTNQVYDRYLQGMNVYMALIPDKNYFAAEENGYPALPYDQMEQLLREGLHPDISYLGMTPFASLTLDSYYRTDLHWKQEALLPVADSLLQAMGATVTQSGEWTQTQYSPFYGSYYGQSALNITPDVLTTLTNDTIAHSIVTSPEFAGEKPVYAETDFQEMDGYNIFLGGPLGIVTVTNPTGTTGKELVIFRDSFSSSLAPLLLTAYDKITLMDLRYLMHINVDRFVEFGEQDILFLYNTGIVNSGKLLK